MQINRPDDLGDIANLGLTLAEGKLLLAGLQQQIVAARAKEHAGRRSDCRSCGGVCRVKDYRNHSVATLFGQVRVRLPRFRCAGCGGTEAGHEWPSHCRSTPELDQLQAHLSALMPYRVAADVLRQVFPVDTGNDPETLRGHTLKIGGELRYQPAVRPDTVAPVITVTLDSTFIRSCEDDERHLEMRVGNAITEGTANFLVNRRMNKSQQMRWSRRGADLLLKVRCAVYNGTLGSGFGRRFQSANDPIPQIAVAA